MNSVIIRKYRQEDRSSVRQIAWDTALMGEPASAFFASREILTDFLTAYFTDYEPQSCFVAEADGRVVGYLIGARDSARLEDIFKQKIFLPLFFKAILQGAFLNLRNLRFGFQNLLSLFRGDFSEPEFNSEYPATLHINIAKDWRNQNIGSKLITAYLEYLAKERVSGVKLATMSEKAAGFFAQQNFTLLHKGKRTYFRYIIKKDVPIYIYGKKI